MFQYTPPKVLFSFGKLNVYSWGLMAAVAIIVVIFLSFRKAKKENLDGKEIFFIGLLMLSFGLIGSRLLYAFENGFSNFFAFYEGGLSWYGSLLGLLAGLIYIKTKKLPMRYLEIVFIFIPLGLAIGRLGCFLNWDDYGKITNSIFAVKVGNDMPRHPSQLYESVASLVMFVIIFIIDKKRYKNKKKYKKHTNEKHQIYRIFNIPFFLFFYSFTRFFLDFLRESNTYYGLTLAQYISLAIIFVLLIFFCFNIKKKRTRRTEEKKIKKQNKKSNKN